MHEGISLRSSPLDLVNFFDRLVGIFLCLLVGGLAVGLPKVIQSFPDKMFSLPSHVDFFAASFFRRYTSVIEINKSYKRRRLNRYTKMISEKIFVLNWPKIIVPTHKNDFIPPIPSLSWKAITNHSSPLSIQNKILWNLSRIQVIFSPSSYLINSIHYKKGLLQLRL